MRLCSRVWSILFLVLIMLLILPLVSAVMEKECFDDGSIKIEGMSKKFVVKAKEKGGDYFEVLGRYAYNEKTKKYTFYSDEALFVSQGGKKYSLKIGKSSSSVVCPPFKFSCRILNMSVDYCYNRNNTFLAKFMVYNYYFNKSNVLRFTQPFLLKYEVITNEGKTLTHAPDALSPDFVDLNITMRKLNSGSKFILQWPTEKKIRKLMIKYNKCRQKRYNFYEALECTDALACSIDKDCQQDETCLKGLCTKLDCGDCQYPQEHLCLNFTCCQDEDCLAEEKCQDHTCTSFSCLEDEKIEEHSCIQLICTEEEFLFNHNCQKLNCIGIEFIKDHRCQPLLCSSWETAQSHQCISKWKVWWSGFKIKIIKG